MIAIRILVVSVGPDRAEELARALLDERLVACVNVVPGVRSLYRWRDAVCDEAEALLVMETSAEDLDAKIARIAALHPYELPKILALEPSSVLPAYLQWVIDESRPRPGGG